MDYTERSPGPHQLILQERSRLELTGVSDVDSFDESAVRAYTPLGVLHIAGSDLHICHLDLANGLLSLEGQVDSMAYSQDSRGGLLRKLFR